MKKAQDDRFVSVLAFLEAVRDAESTKASSSSRHLAHAAQAVGIFVDVRVDVGTQEGVAGAVLDDIGHILAIAERELRSAGLILVFQTGGSLLAARLLGEIT